jgi:hypothetical protein
LDHLEADERFAELLPLLRVRNGDLIRGDRVPKRSPRHRVAGAGEHSAGVLERPGLGEAIGLRHLAAG